MLSLQWKDGSESGFHAIWLRDNCRCHECGEPAVGRRTLRLSELDLDISITRATRLFRRDVDVEQIGVGWSDGHNGHFSVDWLRTHRYDDEARSVRAFSPPLWDDGLRRNPPVAPFSEVMENDESFLKLLITVRDHGICFLRDAPLRSDTLEKLAEKIGALQESNFGRVMDLVVNNDQPSIAYDVNPLKPHTDEPYRASPPGLLLFHCIETDAGGGGASIFVDGFEAAETLRREDPQGFTALTENSQSFRRHFKGDVDLIAEFPVISVDEFGNLSGVRVNDRVAAPSCIRPQAVAAFYRGMKRFLELTEDGQRMIKHTLRPGDIAVFDNHRVLHGRTRLSIQGRRWLQWVQVERGDFHSRMRILSDKFGKNRNPWPFLRGAYG